MRPWLLGLVGLALIGCGPGKTADDTKSEPVLGLERSAVRTPAKVTPPDFSKRTDLRMIRKGEVLHVGDSVDDALRIFPEDKSAFHLADMPPGWKDDSYRCVGWDTASTGFGAIVYNDRIALALYHEDRITEDRLKEILDTYDRGLSMPATLVTGSRVRYWFWEQEPHRLMICAVQVPGDGLNVSIALGDIQIMDLFRMKKEAAENDERAAEDLFREALETKPAKDDKK